MSVPSLAPAILERRRPEYYLERELQEQENNLTPTLYRVEQELAFRSYYEYMQFTWRSVETRDFVPNWHIECLAEHLEAVVAGEIRRLLVNMPPRHTKSSAISVFLCPWAWLHRPELQFLYASYAQNLATRDSIKARRVIGGYKTRDLLDLYVNETGERPFELTTDQNTKTRFENNYNGYRLSTSVDGVATGDGGDIICVDDPHNVKEGESEKKRENTVRWWRETMQSRLNDPKTGAFIVVGQRIHAKDTSGYIIANQMRDEGGEIIDLSRRDLQPWVHLCFPARYETGEDAVTSVNTLNEWEDPREEEGEPLYPGRYDDDELTQLEKDLGSYAGAAQLQQRPSPRQGGIFKVDKLVPVRIIPNIHVRRCVRYWDKAGSEQDGDYSAGVLMCEMVPEWEGPRWIIADVVRGQWSAHKREVRIEQAAHDDRDKYGEERAEIWLEQEPGSGGKESAQNTILNLAGFRVHAETVSGQGNKEVRAGPCAAQVEARNVGYLGGAHWVGDFLDELLGFPNAEHDDIVDGVSGAFNKLRGKQKKRGGAW